MFLAMARVLDMEKILSAILLNNKFLYILIILQNKDDLYT